MPTPIDPTSAGFLLAENRSMPMHVGGLQLFEKPEGAGRDYVRWMFETMRDVEAIKPLYLKHPHRSVRTGGQLVWRDDDQFDIEHHLRHSALPRPGRIRELLELCGRLHGTRLAWERPLWETHVIEGLRDGRVAQYSKLHHALVDGVAAMRLLQNVLSTDPDRRGMPAPWEAGPDSPRRRKPQPDLALSEVTMTALRAALGVTAEAAGMPGALVRTLAKGLRNETSALSLYAPRTIFNQTITGSRRFAAQDWPMERLKAVGQATGTTLNDVVLAMCSGAVRRYLLELDALPDSPLVAMVPVGLNAKQSHVASAEGGNAVGAVMCQLATDVVDPADRLRSIHRSMLDGKQGLSSMTPVQILAMSALGQAPAIITPLLRMQGIVRPPYNLIISNVPGPTKVHYWNGAKMVGTYPLSIPINGMALNITCTSYAGQLAFGLTGCRRTVPHLQRFINHLDDEVRTLEQAAGGLGVPYTSSPPLRAWTSQRRGVIEVYANAHRLMGIKAGRGRPNDESRPLGHAYIIGMLGQFQGFARDLHDLLVQQMVAAAGVTPAFAVLVTEGMTRDRALDRSNATPATIKRDFRRVDLDLDFAAFNPSWRGGDSIKIDDLFIMRNALAHSNALALASLREADKPDTVTWARARLPALNRLARSLDHQTWDYLKRKSGADPWS